FASLTVSGSASIGGDLMVSGMTTVGVLSVKGRIITAGAQPTANALAGPGTVSVKGNDTAGEVIFSSAGVAAGPQFRVSFANGYSAKARVGLTPASPAAAAARFFVESTGEGFVVVFTDPPMADQEYIFNYLAVQ